MINEESVMKMSMSQLNALRNELDLDISQKLCKTDLRKEIILRLEWIGKQTLMKAHTTSSWVPPCSNSQRANFSKFVSVNKGMNIIPEESVLSLSADENWNKLKMEIDTLKAENYKLMSSLQKSEGLRRDMEKSLIILLMSMGPMMDWRES